MKTILLNGPPRSGKDTIGGLYTFSSKWRTKIEKFSAPIKAALKETFSLTDKEFAFFDNEWKDKPHPRLLGFTWRFWCIEYSERFMKIYGGEKVFGNMLAQKMASDTEYYDFTFITDSGFDPEAEALIQDYPGDFYLFQLYRDGCDFSNDSRNYLKQSTKDLISADRCFTIENNGTVEELKYKIDNILDEIYNSTDVM